MAHNVSTPLNPIVATNAKASMTPPNWASTLHTEMTRRRSAEVGGLVTIRYASSAPRNAPTIAVVPDSSTLLHSAARAVSVNRVRIRPKEKAPSS